MNQNKIVLIFLVLLSGIACSSKQNEYEKELEMWYQNRNEELKAPKGYLRLVGLFWLDEGSFTFGSGKEVDIPFLGSELPNFAGTFIRKGNQVDIKVENDAQIFIEGNQIKERLIYSDSVAPTLKAGSFEWTIIKRGVFIGIRLFNLHHKEADEFSGATRFPVDPKWKVKAKLVQNESSKKISIPDVLGQINEYDSPGFLQFDIDGISYSLQTQEYDNEYFIVFGDESNKTQTYQAGRFLYIPKVDSLGFTSIDFNKAINPPCMYSDFTTCPLPPQQNKLPISILAGEKRWEKHQK